MRKIKLEKHGQVWVETVIYTLIGLTIIGILLAVSTPKIAEMKDRMRINEAVDVINEIDTKIIEVKSAPGNRRVINLEISKGVLVINGTDDSVTWIIDSSYAYSQQGLTLNVGDLEILTVGAGYGGYGVSGVYNVNLKRPYTTDITVNGADEVLELEVASIPYSVSIKSQGSYGTDLSIDFTVL